jgi:K+-sensing histidine kinase KdpD
VDNALIHHPGRVSLAAPGWRLVRVRVQDSSPGIPVDELERIFERFYEQTSRSGVDGRWVWARQIARDHSGTLAQYCL